MSINAYDKPRINFFICPLCNKILDLDNGECFKQEDYIGECNECPEQKM